MKVILFVFTAALSTPLLASAGFDIKQEKIKWYKHAKSVSLCKGNESLIFTCKIKNKTASICEGESTDVKGRYLQYRFGMKNNIEVEIPSMSNADSSSVAFMRENGASWYAYYYRFKSGSYKYYLYAASARGDNDPETGTSTRDEPFGLVVLKNNKKILSRKCIEVGGGGGGGGRVGVDLLLRVVVQRRGLFVEAQAAGAAFGEQIILHFFGQMGYFALDVRVLGFKVLGPLVIL